MYFMFGDDSGNWDDTWKVFGGVCMDEVEAFELKKFMMSLKVRNGIDVSEELKPFKKDYKYNTLTKEQADTITYEVYDFMVNTTNLKAYGVFFKNQYLKDNFGSDNTKKCDYCYREASKCFYDKFDLLLNQSDYPSVPQNGTQIPKLGIIIIDEASPKMSANLVSVIKDVSSSGTRFRPSNLVFWGVTLTSSEKNFGVEAAGFIAFAFRKAINDDQVILLNLFKSKIHRNCYGYIDNYGASFFDENKLRGRMSRTTRRTLLTNCAGENFLQVIYDESI